MPVNDKKSRTVRFPIVRAGAKTYPVRSMDPLKILDHKSVEVTSAVLLESKDFNNLLWAGMIALAKDLYSRIPDGTHEFKEFLSATGLKIYYASGEVVLAEKELEKS